MAEHLTTTQLLAATTEQLTHGGYREYRASSGDTMASTKRFFEDAYAIVALHIYDTWHELSDHWPIAQGELVDLMSSHFSRGEAKAWEGYLVLLTPGLSEGDDRVSLIRYDTNRVRKLLATGEELGTLQGLRNALLPLLPLQVETTRQSEGGLLSRLPTLLEKQGISRDVTSVVTTAFQKNESILEELHALRSRQ